MLFLFVFLLVDADTSEPSDLGFLQTAELPV